MGECHSQRNEDGRPDERLNEGGRVVKPSGGEGLLTLRGAGARFVWSGRRLRGSLAVSAAVVEVSVGNVAAVDVDDALLSLGAGAVVLSSVGSSASVSR